MSALAETNVLQPNLGRLGQVVDLDPIGYVRVPYEPLAGPNVIEQSIHSIRGLGHAASLALNHLNGRSSGQSLEPDRQIHRIDGHDRAVLITEPNPELVESSDDIVTVFHKSGLTERDTGSALLQHMAYAAKNPGRRIVTLDTPGVSIGGDTLGLWEGLVRTNEETAKEDLAFMRKITDGEIHLNGTSLGSVVATLIAAENQSANRFKQLPITKLNLLSPAIGGRNIPESERGELNDASDAKYIDGLTTSFFKHMPDDVVRMFKRQPERVAECASVLITYGLEPHKALHRFTAILGNLREVQKGIEWGTLVDVVGGHTVHVLGGELDPLMQAALPQWLALNKLFPRTQVRVMENIGHAMTIDGAAVAEQLSQMEELDPPA